MAKDISKEKAEIQWDMYNPEYIERMVRAFLPWPVVWTRLPKSENKNLSEKIIKIYKAEVVDCKNIYNEVGKLFVKEENLLFTTKDTDRCLRLIEFQIEGRNITNTEDFLKGLGRNLVH